MTSILVLAIIFLSPFIFLHSLFCNLESNAMCNSVLRSASPTTPRSGLFLDRRYLAMDAFTDVRALTMSAIQ
jgi:hypothetical protein